MPSASTEIMLAAIENNDIVAQNTRRATEKVERVKDKVWEMFLKMKNGHKLPQKEDSRFAILKVCKVLPVGVSESLKAFKGRCVNEKMKADIDSVMVNIDHLVADGSVKNFVRYRSKSNMKKDLEYFCLAVRKYKSENGDVCDYTLATFSCSSGIDYKSLGVGLGFKLAAAGMTGLSACNFETAAASLITAGAAAAFSKLGEYLFKVSEEEFDIALEAAFIYELVQRGHAEVDEHEQMLYLVNDD